MDRSKSYIDCFEKEQAEKTTKLSMHEKPN